MSKWNTSNVTN
ncbi:MAG: hypothetical protein IKH33_05935, partial [Bacteroidales bacterium]|nr:hypothetical protein [Bacteroidales bacterium]